MNKIKNNNMEQKENNFRSEWKIVANEKSNAPVVKDLNVVEKIFQRKINLFIDELNSQIEGVRVMSFLSDGMGGEIKVRGLSIDVSDFNGTINKISQYVEDNINSTTK